MSVTSCLTSAVGTTAFCPLFLKQDVQDISPLPKFRSTTSSLPNINSIPKIISYERYHYVVEMAASNNYGLRDSFHPEPIWAAVDEYTKSHLHPDNKPNSAALAFTMKHSHEEGLPNIATYPLFSKMLALQCRIGNVTNALEVGTLGGYTSIWIATMNPQAHIDSLEVEPHHAQVARDNIKHANVADQVTVTLGPALETLAEFRKEIQAGRKKPFGLTYIDADKENNWNYFDLAVQCSKSGSTIFVDNIVRRGVLALNNFEPEDNDDKEDWVGARKLVEMVGKDKRVEAVVMQTVAEKNYDGFLMAVVV